MEKTALLLIDIQNDYFPGGNMEVVGSTQAAQKATEVLASFRNRRLPVVHVQHLSTRKGAGFLLPGSQGAEIHPSVRPLEGEPVVVKHFPNSFRETALLELLRERGIERLVVCGMMTHMCVDTTVRAAFDLGFSCTLIADACATRNLAFDDVAVPAPQVQAAYLAALAAVFAEVVPAADFLAQELR